MPTPPSSLPDTSFFAVLEEPVSVFTLDGTYVYINPAGEAILGMRAADLVGRTYLDAFPDLATHPYHAAFARVASGESAVERLEFHYQPMDRWSSQRIYAAHGHVLVFWQDITDRKHAERALNDSVARIAEAEQQFQMMIEGMPQLAWRARADGFIDYYNPRWYEYTGTTPADMEGWGWQSVHDPVLLPSVMERWQHSIDSGEPFEMEFPLRRHDGAMRWFITRITPLRDDRGQIVRWIGINTDIDEQKRLLSTLDDTLESMGDGFFLLDKDWRLVTVNRKQERVSGTLRKDSLGKRFWDLFPAAAPDSLYWMHYHRVMEQRVDAHFEEFCAPLDLWTEVDAFPARDGGIAVFFRDISERKRAEIERSESLVREQAARVAAEAANRAKDEFLAMLGHELRNPLAPITTGLQLIRLRGVSSSQRELAVIERQVTHLGRLVDDLLDISRISSGKVTLECVPLDLAPVIKQAIETASPLLEERRHTLVSTIPAGLFVEGDPPRLEQVFSNLLMNAAKYTPPGGRIEVAVKQHDDDHVSIGVTDTGIGIAEELLPHVFDIFVQGRQNLDRAGGGLGLGLTIVQRLVSLHGGAVTADSAGVGNGATFSVTLPLIQGDIGATRVAELTARARDATAKRVLVVDDNEDAAELLAELLETQGYVTRTAHDGPSALTTLESFRPDVAVLDIGLPIMDGYELARLIRGHADLGQITILALTGYGQAEDRARTKQAGFDGHLVKPVDYQLLTSLIENR